MTFNVHLAQFDVAPTRTGAGISLICDYLIDCKICDVTLGREGISEMRPRVTRTGEGSTNHEIRVT